MPKTIEEMLADSALTDSIEITFGSEKVTIGELRNYQKSLKNKSDEALADALKRKKDAEEEIAKASRLANDSLKLWEEAEKLKRDGGPAPKTNNGDIDWDADPYYKPVGGRFKTVEEKLASMADEIGKFQKAMAAGMRFVVDNYQQSRWDSLPVEDRPKDKTWRDYEKLAQEQNIKDSHGLFDPIEAWNRSTAADRRAAEIEEARKRGAEDERKKLETATLPRPGSTPRTSRQEPSKFKNLTEALNAAQTDPEIIRIWNEGAA